MLQTPPSIASSRLDAPLTPSEQSALLLHAVRARYSLARIPTPKLELPTDVLVRVEAIGLNPVDWKSADYGFALPVLPALNGRDLAGTVVSVGAAVTRVKVGDRVFGPSTQYRDYRTSAYQQYAIAYESSLGIVPAGSSVEQCAAIGVGAVAAALAIGGALGLPIGPFSPRKLSIGAEGEEEYGPPSSASAAEDKPEADAADTPSPDDHLLIWGGGSVSGFLAAQLALHAGLNVIVVASLARHGDRLRALGVKHIIERNDPDRAVEQIRELTGGCLRYAIDCVGKATATAAMAALDQARETVLVGLSGLPKPATDKISVREVQIKTFHTNEAVGRGLMTLLEDLIERGELTLPPVEIIEGTLEEAVNGGLDRLRTGDVGFGRLVVRVQHA